jgi:hypothetical protein
MKQRSVLFISKEGLSTFWFLLAAAAVLGTWYYLFDLVGKRGLRPQFILLNSPDITSVMPTENPVFDRETVLSQTRLAMDSIFNKTGNGLDAASRCSDLLSADVLEWVQSELVLKQEEVFKEARIHQKVAIERIELRPQPNEDAVLASVQGQLIRVGVMNDQLLNEVWMVRAEMMWMRNINLRTSGRYPLLCFAFNCRETPVASTRRRTVGQPVATAATDTDVTTEAEAATEPMDNEPSETAP